MDVLCIFGTRPEAVKMAPVIQELQRHADKITTHVCVTGQHREMLDQMLTFFNIQPDYDLNLMERQQSLTNLTVKPLLELESLLSNSAPDWVLVQGDTTTAFSSALAAFYHNIKVAHIEAGLRTYCLDSPWPEEANRHLISVVSTVHYAPTLEAKNNLQTERIPSQCIVITGNTVVDALLFTSSRIEQDTQLQDSLARQFNFLDPQKRLILVTGHRRENWHSGLSQVFEALNTIAQRADVEIIYPVHLNPRVQKPAKMALGNLSNVHLIDPIDYISLIYLLQRCYLVVTDSGGIQEEAPTFGKPVLVTRNTTERPEGVAAGNAKLVGTNPTNLLQELTCLLDDAHAYFSMSQVNNPYGDGQASKRIVNDLLERS